MSQPIAAPTPGLVRLVGRVIEARQSGKSFRTLLMLPAADSFQHPATVELVSKARVGQPGTEVDVLCSVGGFKNRPKLRDGSTGEYWPASARNVLEVVAA